MAEIRLERVSTRFGKVHAVDDVSLTIGDREFMVLLGPSGCGKTTLLRSVAGLEQIHSGRVVIGDREVTDRPPRKRDIAMVFQSYAVFPHLTVFENIAFGLRMKKISAPDIKRRVDQAAELLHIGEYLARHPAQLSGGQRQRVAVARAIAMQSGVILMDEPLSNLDALLRIEMRAELKRLLREIESLPNLEVVGLMCLPPMTGDPENARTHFRALLDLLEIDGAEVDVRHPIGGGERHHQPGLERHIAKPFPLQQLHVVPTVLAECLFRGQFDPGLVAGTQPEQSGLEPGQQIAITHSTLHRRAAEIGINYLAVGQFDGEVETYRGIWAYFNHRTHSSAL